jgi:hypothetical protein
MNLTKYLYIDYISHNQLDIRIEHGGLFEDFEHHCNIQNELERNKLEEETIYLFPGTTVPRFKAKEKFNFTILPKKATIAFIPPADLIPRTNDHLFKRDVYKMKSDDFKHWLRYINHPKETRFKMLVDANDFSHVYIKSSIASEFYYRSPKDPSGNVQTGLQLYTSDGSWAIKQGYAQGSRTLFIVPINSKIKSLSDNCLVYKQDELLKYINEDSIIIDKEKYQDLVLMCASEDDASIIMTMELLANSNYEKSFMYILMILKKYGKSFIKYKEFNHVNFKSLLSYFNLDKESVKSMSLMTLTNILKDNKKFTRANVQAITTLCTVDYINFDNANIKQYYIPGPCLKIEAEEFDS